LDRRWIRMIKELDQASHAYNNNRIWWLQTCVEMDRSLPRWKVQGRQPSTSIFTIACSRVAISYLVYPVCTITPWLHTLNVYDWIHNKLVHARARPDTHRNTGYIVYSARSMCILEYIWGMDECFHTAIEWLVGVYTWCVSVDLFFRELLRYLVLQSLRVIFGLYMAQEKNGIYTTGHIYQPRRN
jgi:hypothetical protein